LRALVRSRDVGNASFDTEWIERDFLASFATLAEAPVPDLALAAASIAEFLGMVGTGSAQAPASRARGARNQEAGFDPFRSAGRWRLPGLT
jgi:hypothetical protein